MKKHEHHSYLHRQTFVCTPVWRNWHNHTSRIAASCQFDSNQRILKRLIKTGIVYLKYNSITLATLLLTLFRISADNVILGGILNTPSFTNYKGRFSVILGITEHDIDVLYSL